MSHIEWIVTSWLVVGPASGPMTYGFTDHLPCELWRTHLLTSRVPLVVGACEKVDEMEYTKRSRFGPYPVMQGTPSAGYQGIIDRGLWIGPPADRVQVKQEGKP